MRKEIVTHLIKLDKPLEEISMLLQALSWDSEEEIPLRKRDIKSVLVRYINDSIDIKTLTKWANMIEGREDIRYDESCFKDVKQLVFDLANPDLQGAFNKELAKEWLLKFD